MPEVDIDYGDLDLLNRHMGILSRMERVTFDLVDSNLPAVPCLTLRVQYDQHTPELHELTSEAASSFGSYRLEYTRHQLIERAFLDSPARRVQLARAMVEPLRRRLGYADVLLPMFELAEGANPSISIESIRTRRFDIIERYSSKPSDLWRPAKRHRVNFNPCDQPWPEWVVPGALLRSMIPDRPKQLATVVDVFDDYLTLNWNNQILRWDRDTDWFHDTWQYVEDPPTIWERLNAA